ncbi:MAG: hypothetical protein Q7R64_04680 [bacterium]|nr:hypothetical protein [bacterium]
MNSTSDMGRVYPRTNFGTKLVRGYTKSKDVVCSLAMKKNVESLGGDVPSSDAQDEEYRSSPHKSVTHRPRRLRYHYTTYRRRLGR